MCRVAGYIGKKEALPIILDELRRQSYGGYDSSGVAIYEDDGFKVVKSEGKLENLEKKLEKLTLKGNFGIGHIRWASHGRVTEINAHPHSDCEGNIYLVHNGIIENYAELKAKLIKRGHQFTSDTDTEVVCHLIEEYFQGNLEEAVRKALREVKGAYAFLIVSQKDPRKIISASLSSPLLIGISEHKGEREYFLASDPLALSPYTQKVINLEEREIAIIKENSDLTIVKEKVPFFLEIKAKEAEKGDYPHFMIKEIMEEPRAIERAIQGRLIPEEGRVKLGGIERVSDSLRKIERIILIGCGTANYACRIGKYMIEEYGRIVTEAETGSEFRYRQHKFNENTLAIFVSQSGETADTLASLREMKRKQVLTLGITNMVGSTQARETDAGIYLRSGPEIAVASTKAFIGQLTVLALLTVYFGREREMSLVIGKRIINEIIKLPSLAEKILSSASYIEKLAKKYSQYKNFFFIGRKYNYPIALEGALKLKEVSYLHAEAFPGGELKHGPLALIDENFPTVAICPSDSVYEKMLSNIQEVKAREGRVLAIATENNEEIKQFVDDVIYIPKTLEMLTPILSVIPLHLFAYYIAKELKREIDKPKNLAKSCTVE